MTYILSYLARARRDLRNLNPADAERVINGLSAIKEEPYSHIKKLRTNSTNVLYTWRLGSYRAILTIEDQKHLILVLEIDHRR